MYRCLHKETEAMQCFEEMKEKGLKPTRQIFQFLIEMFCEMRKLEQVKKINQERIKNGYLLDPKVAERVERMISVSKL